MVRARANNHATLFFTAQKARYSAQDDSIARRARAPKPGFKPPARKRNAVSNAQTRQDSSRRFSHTRTNHHHRFTLLHTDTADTTTGLRNRSSDTSSKPNPVLMSAPSSSHHVGCSRSLPREQAALFAVPMCRLLELHHEPIALGREHMDALMRLGDHAAKRL